MIDIEKLKQAALAATQGEWAFGSFHELLVVPVKDGAPDKYDPIANLGETAIPWDMDTYSAERYKNAEHIATSNPSAVLELINRLEAAESQLAAQELVIQQLREALKYIRRLDDDLDFLGQTDYDVVSNALAIPTSTKHLEAWYKEQVGEVVAWGNFKDNGEACLLSISQHPEDRANWMNPHPLHAIKPFPFKGNADDKPF